MTPKSPVYKCILDINESNLRASTEGLLGIVGEYTSRENLSITRVEDRDEERSTAVQGACREVEQSEDGDTHGHSTL